MRELYRLRQVRNIAQLRDFLGMTLAEIAEHIPPQRGKRKHITASTLDGYGKRRPDGEIRFPGRAQLDAIALLCAERLTTRYNIRIGVWADMNSPLKLRAGKVCPQCRRAFEIKRYTDKCRRCNK